jgi:Protein of unknown function (DUF2892)
MKPNIGRKDKTIRLSIAIILIILGSFNNPIHDLLGWRLSTIPIALILTVIFNFCPMCMILGTNTCEISKK